MGLYRRLFKGASRDDVAPRSPEDARAAQELAEELRDLKDEIRKLREALQESPQSSRRGESRGRGGRGRSSGGSRSRGGSFSERGRKEGPAKVPPDDAPTGPLVDYLKKQKVTVFEGQDDLARNEAFEHLARHLGQHFSLLANFYEKMKRAVATGRTTRVDIEGYSEAERSAAVQLGTLLYRHGMLKDFYYHRSPRKQLRVIPTKDGETQQFLTGGWLEIYVVWLLSKRLRGHLQPKQFQVLFNVKGTLPTGNEFEADLMASINGHLLWLECKTGQWQDYSARFRGLVKVFGTNRKGAGLVLIKTPDASTRGRATDMLDMTLLSLDDVENYVDEFLEIPESERLPKQHKVPKETSSQQRNAGNRSGSKTGGDGEGGGGNSRRRRRTSTSGSSSKPDSGGMAVEEKGIETSPEDAKPLENPEPAKRLGKVDLEEGRAIPRRRRRRRSRSRAAGEAAGETAKPKAEGDTEALREELPIQPLKGEGGSGAKAASKSEGKAKSDAKAEEPSKPAEPEKPLIPAGMVAKKPNWPEVTEDRKAKDVEDKADAEAKQIDEDAAPKAEAEAEPKARRPRRRRRTKKVVAEEAADSSEAKADSDGEAKAEADVAKSEPAKGEADQSAKSESADQAERVKQADKSEKSEKSEDAEPKKKAKPRAKRKTTRSRRKPADSEGKLEQADLDLKSSDDNAKADAKANSNSDAKAESKADAESVDQTDSGDKPKPARKKRATRKKAPAKAADSKKKSASGVTIMPDLSAMMAGSTKQEPKKDDQNKD